jgi:tryptophanyl-tRNA synthetase
MENKLAHRLYWHFHFRLISAKTTPMEKARLLSGVQPSGQPSLGNYLGAFQQFVSFQKTHDALYCIVDHHAITVRQDPATLHENTFAIAAWYIASGLDPKKCALFIQSHVPAHVELGWILNTFTQMGELERMTQFKDKAARHKQNINAGLFTYPCLMAADILLYNTQAVPVGEDQTQHLELARNIAARFNGVYGKTFALPETIIPKAAARVKDLQDPTRKMSKSEEGLGTVFLLDDMKTIEKKIKKAVTDNVGAVNLDEKNQPGVANLLGILAACEGKDVKTVTQEWQGRQYGPFKQAVAEAVVSAVEPVQKRYRELMEDKAQLAKILNTGAEKAHHTAEKNLRMVKEKIGYVLP